MTNDKVESVETSDVCGKAACCAVPPLADRQVLSPDDMRQMLHTLGEQQGELQRRVAQLTARLETANRELDDLTYAVSHDLCAPLRGIEGWSQAFLEDFGGPLALEGEALAYIHRICSESRSMGQRIDALLQLARLAREEMRSERVNLSSVARTVVARLQESEPERAVEFTIQPDLSAVGDPKLLEITLRNLLGNAFKFTGKTNPARIEFGQADVQGQRAFFVRDNGAGYDMTFSKKLFGAFQRMHSASDFPGTGIGLATVQRLIHRHGGRVWSEAHINQGATFYFTLGER